MFDWIWWVLLGLGAIYFVVIDAVRRAVNESFDQLIPEIKEAIHGPHPLADVDDPDAMRIMDGEEL